MAQFSVFDIVRPFLWIGAFAIFLGIVEIMVGFKLKGRKPDASTPAPHAT